jgi:hypothetical protein
MSSQIPSISKSIIELKEFDFVSSTKCQFVRSSSFEVI